MQTIRIPSAFHLRLRLGDRCPAAVSLALAVCSLTFSSLSSAADAAWTGAENALWTNSANWSASPYPGSATGETATFDGAGNGNTVIELDGFSGVRNITFGAHAAAYTLGTSGQTLILGSTLAADPGLAAPQTVNAALQLGTDRASGTYILTNPSPALVTLAGGIRGALSGGTAGAKSLHIGGNTLVGGVIANGGASSVSLTIRRGASTADTVTLTAANTFSGGISVSDGCLVLKNSAALGSGGKTVTIANNANGARPSIWLDGTEGDLDIPASVAWSTSNAKEGALVNIAGTNTVRGNFTLTGGDGDTWLISRGGKLTLTGNFSPNTATRKLGLRGDADGEISGVIANGSTPDMPVYKNDGAGTWTLSGANTYSGYTEASAGTLEVSGAGRIASSSEIRVSSGATFRVRNTSAASHADRLKDTAPVNLSGSTFDFAGDGGAYAETVGALNLLSGANGVSVAPSARLTFAGLSAAFGATVAFAIPEASQVFIDGQPEGPLGGFATVNGVPAHYSQSAGVYAGAPSVIAAHGDVIPATSGTVTITTEGATDPNELAATVTAVGALVQASPFASTVNTAEKTLNTSFVMIATNGADLTLGVAPNDGSLTAPGSLLTLANDSDAALTVNALIADAAGPLSLLKTGTGTAVLAASNTFSGAVQVNNGTLLLKNSQALQNVTLTPVTGNIRFDPAVPTHAFAVAALTNNVPLALEDTDGNPVTLTAFGNVPAATFSGGLTGSGTLVKAGNGILTLAGDNFHTGATVINAGTVTVTTSTQGLGHGSVVNDGTVNLTRGNVTYYALTNSISGSGTFNVTLASGTGTAIASGDASGFTGTWNVGATQTGGKLNLSGADNAAATVNVLSNATLFVTGPVTKQATAVLFGGKTGENQGQLRLDAGADWAGTLFLAGDHTDPGFGLIGSGSSTGTISGLIADLPGTGLHPLHKAGGGQLQIANPANTYTGPTWLRSGAVGVTSLKNSGEPSSLGAPSAENAVIMLGTSTTAARLAYFGTGDATDRALDMAGTTGYAYIEHSGTGLLKFTAPAVLASGAGSKSLVLQGDTAGIGEIAGAIGDSASGTHTLVKQGSGTWALSAQNTFTGLTDIRNGTLSFTHPRAAAGSSLIQMTTAPGGTLSLDNNAADEPEKNFTVGVNCPDVTLALGAGPDGQAVTHGFNDWSFSRVTVTVARAASVLSGTPAVTARTLNLSSGSVGDTRLRADGTDVHIGSAAIRSGAYAKTLILDGDTHANTITGEVANGVATLSLQKEGSGTWTLSGANTYAGPTSLSDGALVLSGADGALSGTANLSLSGGAALIVSNAPAANNPNRLKDAAPVALTGGTLAFAHSRGDADYSETLGSVTATGGGAIQTSQADGGHTSALTLGSLASPDGGVVALTGPGLGESDRNRIFITAQPEDYVGPWLTLNGSGPVLYSAALGLHLGTGFSPAVLAARGDTIPDGATISARITTPGTSGHDTLAGTVENSLAFLTQTAEAGTPATVAMPGKTLKAYGLAIETDGAALTLGTAPGEGAVTALVTGGKLDLANASGSALTVNAATADNGAPVTLAISGGVTLAGPAAHTGRTLLSGGTLTFASDLAQTLSSDLAGTGTLIKGGTNTLYLTATNTFSGPVMIANGVVRIDQNNAFGAKDGGVFISGQGTLDVGGNRAANTLALGTEPVTISGAGYLGQGAIVNASATDQNTAVSKLDLAGDATVGGTRRWDVRNSTPVLNLSSHTLTKTGTNLFGITSATVTPGEGHITVEHQAQRRADEHSDGPERRRTRAVQGRKPAGLDAALGRRLDL
jgi:autotransporter-associated beta strand protein